ncbi:MAG: fasciclin domain-containing protein [bacterium]|nr:fasciclin domain-containing protein [bacterium]
MRRMPFVMLFALCLWTVSAAAQTPAALPTIAETLESDPRYQDVFALYQAHAPELLDSLNDPSRGWTLFAPANGALERMADVAGIDPAALAADTDRIRAILHYLLVPTRLKPDSLGYVDYGQIGTMLVDHALSFANNGANERADFVEAAWEGVEFTANGVIFQLDDIPFPLRFSDLGASPDYLVTTDVLQLPDFNPNSRRLPDVLTALESAGNFTYITRYLRHRPDQLARLEDGGVYTFLASTDPAWLDMFGTPEAIETFLFADVAEGGFDAAGAMFGQSTLTGYFTGDYMAVFSQEGLAQSFKTIDDYSYVSVTALIDAGSEPGIGLYGLYALGTPITARNVMIYPLEWVLLPG